MVSRARFQSTKWHLATFGVLFLVLVFNAYVFRLDTEDAIDFDKYTYLGTDFPPTMIPLSEYPYDSVMHFDNTVYYAPDATLEWASTFPFTAGVVRLGPNDTMYGISAFHQLHCLEIFTKAIVKRPTVPLEWYHVSHCLNYLRQAILCSANTRLEPVKESPRGLKVDGLGLVHQCRDWTRLWNATEENYRMWERKKQSGSG